MPSRTPMKLFFNLIQFFSNSCVPDHILKVLFDPIQFFSFRTRIGGLTRNSVHRAWSTSPSLSTSKRRQLLNWLKASKDKLMWWRCVVTLSVTSVSSRKWSTFQPGVGREVGPQENSALWSAHSSQNLTVFVSNFALPKLNNQNLGKILTIVAGGRKYNSAYEPNKRRQ